STDVATAAPQPASPSNGASGQTTTPTLSWSAPSGAIAGTTLYTVTLWDPYAPPVGRALPNLAATTATSIAVPASESLLYGQQYAWSVFACTGSPCTIYGAWFSFTTMPQLAATPSGVQPLPILPQNGNFLNLPGWTSYGGSGTGTLVSPVL